ncbi:hypothetical protein [Nocardia sp. NPDC052566]|uniref:hypothetical protein n=1 Tax=Nocardia sp. NPDC052566 TaxID=3364330 RepID=UPI0037CAC618
MTLRASALEARATASEQALDEQGDVLTELAALTRKALDGIDRIDERTGTIGDDLVVLRQTVGDLRQDVGELNRRVAVIEQGMARVLERLDTLIGDK